MSMVQSRRPEKKSKNSCNIDPNPRGFPKTFPTEMKLAKNEARKTKEKGRRKVKRKRQDCCVTSKPNNYLKINFCFPHMPKLRKQMFCIWIRKQQSTRPANGFLASFSSLYLDSDQNTAQPAFTCIFSKIPRSEWVN